MRSKRTLAVVLPMLALWGCATPQQQVAGEENMLAAAGFEPRPADTPSRLAMLRNLPPNRFSMRKHGDSFVYIYPDPLDCGCVYFGDQDDYARYRQAMQQRQFASDQLIAAQMNQDAAWDWAPWGPWGGWGY